MRTWVVIAALMAVVVLAGAVSVCVIFGPQWIVGTGPGLSPADRLRAENDVRSTLLQGLCGLLAIGGVVLGAAMTLAQLRINRRGQNIDLFTKAIDQLASAEVTVRHGGVYAMERLSDLDKDYRGHVHALLTAFIRRRAPWPPTDPEFDAGEADDIAGALGALGRGTMIAKGDPSALQRVDLRGADLDELDIPSLLLAHSNLEGASLIRANLAGADLSHADLRGVNLTGARLDGADLTGVIADETTVWPAGFTPPGG